MPGYKRCNKCKKIQVKTNSNTILKVQNTILALFPLMYDVTDFPGHHFYRQQYSYLSALMEMRISRAEREVRHQLKLWEQQQLAKTGEVSTTKDMLADSPAKLLLDRLKYCKTLANEWRKEKCL